MELLSGCRTLIFSLYEMSVEHRRLSHHEYAATIILQAPSGASRGGNTMSTSQPTIQSLEDQFEYELEAVYDMERKLVEALEEMADMATNDTLSDGFDTHREETEMHVQRVEEVFEALGREPTRRDCPITDGLLEEKEQYDARVSDEDLRNLYYLGAGMKTERIEITSYEALLMTADKAGYGDEITTPLENNLKEEEQTFRKLQGLSTGSDLKTLWDKLTS